MSYVWNVHALVPGLGVALGGLAASDVDRMFANLSTLDLKSDLLAEEAVL